MKKRKSVILSKLIKLKRLEKQIKLESAKDVFPQKCKKVVYGKILVPITSNLLSFI